MLHFTSRNLLICSNCNISNFVRLIQRDTKKNSIEPKQRILGYIILRLQHDIPSLLDDISHDLYSSDMMPAVELVRGFNKPIQLDQNITSTAPNLLTAHDELVVRRK